MGTRRVVLNAPAKLNLHLGIYAQLDERRYHRADSLMVALDLCDTVEVSLREGGDAAGETTLREGRATAGEGAMDGSLARGDSGLPHVACDPAVDVPVEKNTAYRAALEMAERVGRVPSVDILIRKRVPAQAGMGGSSSDAAAVLRALCELWGVDVADMRVLAAARSVGADVPFFLDPVPTLLVGAGDVVAEKFARFSRPISVVLVRPEGAGVSTPTAYAAFDEAHEEPADVSALCELLREGGAGIHSEPYDGPSLPRRANRCAVTAQAIAPLLANNLDPVACWLLPAVARTRSWLLAQDEVLGGQVTGSGSCVFGLCASDADAARVAARAAAELGAWAVAAHIV